jgi:hypothetical protein
MTTKTEQDSIKLPPIDPGPEASQDKLHKLALSE